MKKAILIFGLILFAGFATQVASAQDTNTDSHTLNLNLSELALINIVGSSGTTITLAPTTTTAGELPTVTENTSLWLNVTSVISCTETRTINVKTSAVIDGFDVKIAAAACTSGTGTFGSVAGSALTLTTSDQALVTGIGSCYTSTGVSSGYNLTYSTIANTGFGSARANNTPITITYTITND
jgi:hypothetical protein